MHQHVVNCIMIGFDTILYVQLVAKTDSNMNVIPGEVDPPALQKVSHTLGILPESCQQLGHSCQA